MVAHTFNSSTWEAVAGSLGVRARQVYIVRPCLSPSSSKREEWRMVAIGVGKGVCGREKEGWRRGGLKLLFGGFKVSVEEEERFWRWLVLILH